MPDVRALLKDERAARRVNHPQAQYSTTGTLICKACKIQLKSDALWPSHLSSPQHINTLKSLAAGLKSNGVQNKGLKRKISDEDEPKEEALAVRKRARPDEDAIRATFDDEPKQAPSPPAETTPSVDEAGSRPTNKKHKTDHTIDEDEWAAFERDVATPPPEVKANTTSLISAEPTISAAPMTAAELAAKSRKEASVQAKERREAEVEGEKEDAQRRLEEEFDQMEELEERVRRLKEKREALRSQLHERKSSSSHAEDNDVSSGGNPEEAEDEDESDFDDGWDDWGNR